MRYIFTAAIGTLLVIAALLALPPIGETESSLIPQTAGDRLAIVGDGQDVGAPAEDRTNVVATEQAATSTSIQASGNGTLSRAVVSPIEPAGDVVFAEVLGEVQTAAVLDDLIKKIEIEPASISTDRSLSIEPQPAPVAPPAETETTVVTAAETTTVAPTTTTTTTTAAPTTTTTAAPAPPAGSTGVVISPRGVVLPIIAPGANGGFRAATPCGNEVTITNGTHVPHVDFVLDAGHGGSEPGAVAYNGVTEKDLNLRVAQIVEWYLVEAGYTVLQTRTTDIRLPLRTRAAIAVAIQPDAFVSIHHNGGATRFQDTPGSELFVDGGNPEARRLGGLMFEEMIDHFSGYEADWVGGWRNGVGTRLNESGADLYGIHRFTPGIPSVITEAGYMSNPSEADLFVTNEFQWSHGKAIADAMIRWRTSADVGYGYLDDFVDGSSNGTGGFHDCTDPEL